MFDASRLPDVRALHPELKKKAERAYAAHMLAREQAFEALFGPSEDGGILSPTDPQLAVNWPGGGVYCYPPSADRKAWLYVTHGLAQPEEPEEVVAPDDEDACSGFGIEYVMSTPSKEAWVPTLLLAMVRQLLFVEEARPFVPGDRMKSSGFSHLAPGTRLGAILGAIDGRYESDLRLPAGACTLVHLVGVTPLELERAKSLGKTGRGTEVLIEVLRQMGPGLDTDVRRECLVGSPAFEAAWIAAQATP